MHDFKAEYVGPNVVNTGFHIEVTEGTPIEEADRIAHEVEEKVSREAGCQHCVIHVDPATLDRWPTRFTQMVRKQEIVAAPESVGSSQIRVRNV